MLNRLKLAALAITTCLVVATSLGAQPADSTSWMRVDSVLAEEMRATQTPGAVVVAIRGDSVVYLKARGVASVETGAPVTPETMFRVASVTKMFTGLTASLLAERAVVDLSAPIGLYAGDLAPGLRALTLRGLLSHTAGLRDAFAVPGAGGAATLRAPAQQLDVHALLTDPGTVYSYSNIGFMLAGYVLESASGVPFAELVDREVLAPLGMKHSTLLLTMAMTHPLALGHEADAADPSRAIVMRPFTDKAELLPRAGLYSTAPDMARFASALMNATTPTATHSLSRAAIARTMEVHASAPADPPGGVPEQQYGLGMRITQYRGHREVGHLGGGVGYGAVVRLLPDQRKGVVVLANLDSALLNRTADAVLDALLSDDVSPAMTTAAIDAPVPLSDAEARALVGRYRNAADETLIFSMQSGELVLEDETPLRVQRVGPSTLAVLAPDGAIALRMVIVPGSADCIAFLFAFGRAFQHEGACAESH
ncbi:MAG TPA: serine hydrolase domain-containing protein [Gemmatimonadota bacterium]|nr:serine hydrolase domain-containing protein [Gemmatimonadota bacterium]